MSSGPLSPDPVPVPLSLNSLSHHQDRVLSGRLLVIGDRVHPAPLHALGLPSQISGKEPWHGPRPDPRDFWGLKPKVLTLSSSIITLLTVLLGCCLDMFCNEEKQLLRPASLRHDRRSLGLALGLAMAPFSLPSFCIIRLLQPLLLLKTDKTNGGDINGCSDG